MSSSEMSFNRGVIRPIECVREGWSLIKSDYWTFLGVTFVGIMIGAIAPLGILLGPMMCGIYLCLLGLEKGRPASMNRLFKGFDYFLDSFVATLFMILPMFVIFVPLYIMMVSVMISTMKQGRGQQQQPDPTAFFMMMGIFYAVVIVVSLAINVLFFFVFPLIADRRLKGVEAVKLSFSAVMANFGGVVGLVLLNALLAMLGLCGCYIGAFFVMPLNFAAIAVAYRRVFPTLTKPDIDEGDDFDEPRDPLPRTGIQGRRDRIQ